MTGFFSPNPSILSNWKTTIAVAFQGLRRIKFVTDNTFEYVDVPIKIDWQTMTVTNVIINRLRGIKLKNHFFFSVDFSATLAAPFSGSIGIDLPYTAVSPANAPTPTSLLTTPAQGGGFYLENAGARETGNWSIYKGSSRIVCSRAAGGNYTAGAARVAANGFIEINEG